MRIFGFVGKSGSGKSHHAMIMADKLKASCLIDDGLLIYKGVIKAGYSAKFEMTALAAVRRAIFVDPVHREQVKRCLDEIHPECILILGTSQRMIQQICMRLELPVENIEWIYVEDILSPSDIQQASDMRSTGMHAIPVQETRLQQSSPLASLIQRIVYHVHVVSTGTADPLAPTIVRPIFADGGIYIHPRVVQRSLEYFLLERQHPFRLRYLKCDMQTTAQFHLYLQAEWQEDLKSSCLQLLRDFSKYLQDTLGFPYPQVYIRIVSISAPSSD